MTLETLIAQYGLAALFVGAGVEGESVVMLGGLMVHRGLLPYWPAIAAAAGGTFLADQAFFLLGRKFRDHPRVRTLMARPAFARAAAIFARHPTAFVFAFRFLYGLRIASPLAIGTTALPAVRFLLLNALAALLWATIFVTLGYWFGLGLEAAFGRFRAIEHLLLIGLGAAAAVALLGWLVRRRL